MKNLPLFAFCVLLGIGLAPFMGSPDSFSGEIVMIASGQFDNRPAFVKVIFCVKN